MMICWFMFMLMYDDGLCNNDVVCMMIFMHMDVYNVLWYDYLPFYGWMTCTIMLIWCDVMDVTYMWCMDVMFFEMCIFIW